LCGVFTGGTTGTLYLNGVQVATGTVTYSFDSSSGNLIGNWESGSGGNPFKGYINDARIYNRALSASEIAGMYLVHN
jgi:hypothetical protein